MSAPVATAGQSTQYAMKKRKKPKARSKQSEVEESAKSNPSKRHRDRLNTELDRLSQLIPLPQDVVSKLDKLSILRLSVAYLRNKSYTKHIELEQTENENKALLPVNRSQAQPAPDLTESEIALQALDGFIIVVTQDFNVFYITSTVQDCLGFPQSDVIYQSMLDLIHAEDRKLFMQQMLINPMGPGLENAPEDGDPPTEPDYVRHGLTPDVVKQLSKDGLLHRSFICRLRCLHDTSSGFLALHFTGHLGLVPGQNRHQKDGSQLPPELGLFLLASPLQTPSILEIRTKNYIFRTKHKLDYTPLGIDQKGRIVLGYTEQELRQQSGYQFIHSADMMHCADAHTKLMRKGQSGLTVFRLLHRANRWQWVTASARLIFNKGIPEHIISTHRPISDQEGEEHLKKRSVAFRFDFTGHASLYASVNPIGAGPPPSNNNRSYGDAPEAKPNVPKRARIAEQEIDPATIYGAQSFQSMHNYPEGLPNVKAAVEPYNDPMGLVKSEDAYDGGYFKHSPSNGSLDSPLGYNVGSNKMMSPRSDNADSGYSDTDFQNSPAYNNILEDLVESEFSPPLPSLPITEAETNQYMPGYISQNHVAQPTSHMAQPQTHMTQQQTRLPQPSNQIAQPQIHATQQASHMAQRPNHMVQPQAHMAQQQAHVIQPQRQMPVQPHYGQNVQSQPIQAPTWAPPARAQMPPMAPQMPLQQHPQHGIVMNGGVSKAPNVPLHNGTNQYNQGYTNQQGSARMGYQQQNQAYQNHSPPIRQAQQQQGYQQPNQQPRYQQQQPQQHNQQQAQYQQINQPPPPQIHGNRMYQHQNQYQNHPAPTNQVQAPMFPQENATKRFVEQINPPHLTNGYYHRHTTSMPKENVSVLNAVEISSTITTGQNDRQRQDMQNMIDMLGPQDPNVTTKDKFEISLEYQENTIQFDMDKIAAEYQTTNPLEVIQQYVQNNPNDALALATGNMPEAELRNVMPSNIAMQHYPAGKQMHPTKVAPKRTNQGYMQPRAMTQQSQQQQQEQQQQHVANQPPAGMKSEKTNDELDFDLEEFLTFDIPHI